MKIKTISTIHMLGVLASLSPLVVYLVNPTMFHERFVDILNLNAGICTLFVFLMFFGLGQTLVKTETGKLNMMPMLLIIWLMQFFLLFIIESQFFADHWETISEYGGSLIVVFVFFMFFGGDYQLWRSFEAKKETSKKKKTETA